MLLQEKVDNLKKSRITRLNWDNATVGLRVSLFNLEIDKSDSVKIAPCIFASEKSLPVKLLPDKSDQFKYACAK